MQFPDVRIEYEQPDGREGREDLELATEHYNSRQMAAKRAAGFTMHGGWQPSRRRAVRSARRRTGAPMTVDERAAAVEPFGFTPRQARFLTTVMLHAGVCVQRQYAQFAGIANGQLTRDFFARLVRDRIATAYPCWRGVGAHLSRASQGALSGHRRARQSASPPPGDRPRG